MSGTSADAIDAALVDLTHRPTLIASHSSPLSAELRHAIHALSLPSANELDRAGKLDVELGHAFADCVNDLLYRTDIKHDAILGIGSHGQTIRHRPPGSPEGTFTLQIGDPNIIAYKTGITTVADFRRRDMAMGGQGAPLVPAFHQALFHSPSIDRVIVNIGGMANITWLPSTGPVIGFDTGPGNVLMDGWISEHCAQHFDSNGEWARTGRVCETLLDTFLREPFFAMPPPKSTGRELFTRAWVAASLSGAYKPEDVQATLAELTAITIANDIRLLSARTKEVIVCGGGARNGYLLARLEHHLHQPVLTTNEVGVDAQWIEAMAFAWMAKNTLHRQTSNLPSVTGANGPAILGGVYFG